MRKYFFYVGIVAFILFEAAHVYLIMPMPGSQEMESVGTAYFLESWKWGFRSLFAVLIISGLKEAFQQSRIATVLGLMAIGFVFYTVNFEMAADTMFYQPKSLLFASVEENQIDGQKLILGIEYQGESKAYPIQFLGYHHQVVDSIGDKPVIITYCTVCRTGRVYEPLVNGKNETFRLVGMDHFNAMFEDRTTKSWWRQATGEACAGDLKGQRLPEFPSTQMTLNKWLELYPGSLVMQPDSHFQVEYDSMATYEGGRITGKLTRRDTLAWQPKSWIAGIAIGRYSKAYDWKDLQQKRVISDQLAGKPVVVLMASDQKSIVAFHRQNNEQVFSIQGDTIFDGLQHYLFNGKSLDSGGVDLQKLNVYQEYWHSWMQFHPYTTK